MSSPHQDASNDTMNVMDEPALMEFNTLEGGGLVTANPSHHIPLIHLLCSVNKDVYYSVDVYSTKESDPSHPSLVLAVKEKFPEVDPSLLHLAPSNDAAMARSLLVASTTVSCRWQGYKKLSG